jgi:hypothetical protein
MINRGFYECIYIHFDEILRVKKTLNIRPSLMHSKELPGIIRCWWKPPLSPGSHHSWPKGGRDVLEAFEVMRSTIKRELDSLAQILSSLAGKDVDEGLEMGELLAAKQVSRSRAKGCEFATRHAPTH